MDRKEEETGRAEVHTHIGLGPDQDHAEEADPLDELSRGGRGRTGGRARDFAASARHRAASALEERTGIVRLARENPLATVGVAFALGFLVAGKSSASGRFGRARQQLRGAIIGAVSAAVAQETHNLTGGASGLLAGLFGGGDEEEDEPRPAGRTRRPRDY
jgi:hypothetical protein